MEAMEQDGLGKPELMQKLAEVELLALSGWALSRLLLLDCCTGCQ